MSTGKTDRIVIVGGGISGVASAVSLASAGVPVVLLESGKLGGGATSLAQGWLHSGGAFAEASSEMARLCLRSLQQTEAFCPQCLESPRSGMYYLTSDIQTPTNALKKAWGEAGLPWKEVGRNQLLAAIPELNPELVQKAYLLPDRAFRPDVLTETLAATARNAGVEIRTGVGVERVTSEDGQATGVVTLQGEEIAASHVILSAASLPSLLEHPRTFLPDQPEHTPAAATTELVSVRPNLTQIPFVVVDRHQFNHIPHIGTSIFHSGVWRTAKTTSGLTKSEGDFESVWNTVQEFFPGFEREACLECHEWTGTSIEALGADQIEPGRCPWPTVVNHGAEGGVRNLWSLYPGRATLWPVLADLIREEILAKMDRGPLKAAPAPWNSQGN
ncbi:MAG: FAD-binding oxidoreductase [Planctomycetaceae bacterium]|nr:FAD-binding oxidoreductase [Planctomycetaceae bacterium]